MTTSAVNDGNPTMLDMIRKTEPNGAIAKVVEALSRRSAVLQDMTWVQGNLPTGHRFTTRTGLPSIGWTRFNEGVAASKSRTDQIDETCGMLKGKSIVDIELASLNGNSAAFRADEDMSFLASFNNELEQGIFYHSSDATPEKFHGLSPRLDLTTGTYGSQVFTSGISHSGNDQTSVWLIAWSPDTVFGIYPKGSQVGLSSMDRGIQEVDDAAGRTFSAYQTNWTWKIGLCVKDYRYVVRIANVDTSAIAATGKLLITAMVKAVNQLYDTNTGRPVFYVNRTVATYLQLQALDTANSTLTIENVGGKPITMFMGIPIRVTDGLLNTETEVS